MKKFLLIGLDPEGIDISAPGDPAGMTAEKLLGTITDVQKHFADQGDHLDNCKVKPDGSAEATVTEQLAHTTYNCILIGGGLEDPKNMEMFERILNSIVRHAPGIPIGLVNLPKDAPETVARLLPNGSTASPTQSSDRAAHVLSPMKEGDDAFNRQDIAAMNAVHHPDIIAYPTDVIKDFLANTAPDKVEAAAHRLVSDDATYISLNFENSELKQILPWTGTSKGQRAFIDAFAGVAKSWTVEEFTITDLFGSGEDVAVFGAFTYRSNSLGKSFRSPLAIHAKVQNEKIVFFQFMEDTFASARSFSTGGKWTIKKDANEHPYEV